MRATLYVVFVAAMPVLFQQIAAAQGPRVTDDGSFPAIHHYLRARDTEELWHVSEGAAPNHISLPALAHGTAEDVREKHWTWCSGWHGIPYPCRQWHTVTKYRYESLLVDITHYGVFCTYDACESDNIRHNWSGGCLGAGSSTCYWSGLQRHKLSNNGSCKYEDNPSILRCP